LEKSKKNGEVIKKRKKVFVKLKKRKRICKKPKKGKREEFKYYSNIDSTNNISNYSNIKCSNMTKKLYSNI